MLARVMTLQCQASIAGQASDLALLCRDLLVWGSQPCPRCHPAPAHASPGFCSHVGWESVQFWKWLQLVAHYNVATFSRFTKLSVASPSWLAPCSETHHAHGNLGVHATCRPCHAIASNHRHSQQAGALPTPMGLVGISSQLCTQVNCICDRLGHMTTAIPHCHWTKFSPPKKFQFGSHRDCSNTKPFTGCSLSHGSNTEV